MATSGGCGDGFELPYAQTEQQFRQMPRLRRPAVSALWSLLGIPEAREVYLSRKDRKVLAGSCRSPVTLQRDLKRARIVLLAATGRSTRSIAKEVGVQPRIVSLWRHRYADHGLEGLKDKSRPC